MNTDARTAGKRLAVTSRLGGYLVVASVAVAAGAGGAIIAMRLGGQPESAATAVAGDHAGTTSTVADATGTTGSENGPSVPAGGAVQISAARQQLIGVRTTEVSHQALDRTVRTVGVLAYDETRVAEIHTKIAGWVERVHVDFVGKPVRRGQPLLTLYSPELVATQKEYLLALKAQRELGQSEFAETRAGAETLVAAARERLRLWDVSDAQVAELERTREAHRTITLYSPFTGVVMERNTFAGQYITPEMSTVQVADLSTVWAVGDVFEYEMPAIRLGQAVTVEFPYGHVSKPLTGRVAFIYPDVDPQTRRGRIRVDFSNPGLTFKPGSFVTLTIQVPAGHELAVPREAVIDTGSTQYVILARENGYFEPREISVGAPAQGYYPVVKGLTSGDRVVTSAQFLIDSETNLQAAMKSMTGHGMGGSSSAPSDQRPLPTNHGTHQP